MSLMHPMYNHLGRSRKRKRKKSASLLKAEKEHSKYIEGLGLTKVKNTTIAPPLKTEQNLNTIKDEKSIDEYDWSPCIQKKKLRTTKTYTIAPAYNKGAYQVISKQHIKDIGK